ncbi:MAG TPA: flagellin [Candidatus Baltobacteraceae bacterium]|nr:flagellin [Candidatus Baltobacteraceae bacterium]
MDVLGGANRVELNLLRSQNDERTQMNALASGLRVNSASDDPSGYSIAQTIQTKVNGLQQGIQNVQEAGSLLNVADATLSNVQTMLQRVHSLVIEAASDLNSPEQLQTIQSEIDQLLQEINKVSGNAKFNGLTLFDGSLNSLAGTSPFVKFVQPDQNPDGSNPNPQVYDENNTGGPNPGPLIFQDGATPMFDNTMVAGFNEFQIIAYSNNPVTPMGPLGQPGVEVKITQYSTDPNFGGTNGAKEQVSYTAWITQNGIDQGAGPGNPLFLNNASGSQAMLAFGLANLSPQDVGVAAAVETFYGTAPGTGQAAQINTGGSEGSVVQVNLPQISTTALQISGISVLDPQTVDWLNNPIGTSSNQQACDDAEIRVENAISMIGQARAQVGSQVVAMNEETNGAANQIVNQVASESAIRDVNVGQAAAKLTMDQVLSKVGMSVLAQMQNSAQLVVQLVSGSASHSSSGRA